MLYILHNICELHNNALDNWQPDMISFGQPPLLLIGDGPLHQEPGQKPGQPGKAWPGWAFRVLGQAYQENAAW